MTLVVTADINAYDPAVPGAVTLRYSTHGYVSGATESPAHTYYDNRIIQAGNFQRTMFEDARTFGSTRLGFGEILLANYDGGLDGLLNYGFAGRDVVIRLADVTPGVVPVWTTIISGTVEQAEFNWDSVRVLIRDNQLDLAKPLQQIRYAGTNSLPNGLEGVADLKNKPKPLIYGRVFNIAPPQVNTDRRIYQLHDGSALQSVDAVYDRGAPLSAGAAYSSQADMEGNIPSAGQYRVWNSAAGCFFRLGSAPSGTVTADATQGAAASNRTVAQLWNAILLKAGITAGSISSADVTALDAAVSYEAGVFASHDADESAIELLDDLCNSVGAWYGTDALGTFRIGRVVLPNIANSVGTLTAVNVVSIQRIAPRDAGVGIPVWKVKLGFQRYHEVQDDLTASVADARKSQLSQEYRREEASDATVKTANPLSPEIEINTQLTTLADASAEASRRLTLYKTRRDMYRVTVRVDQSLASVLDLGKVVTLQLNRYGMSSGKAFLITGIQANMREYLFTLTLWG